MTRDAASSYRTAKRKGNQYANGFLGGRDDVQTGLAARSPKHGFAYPQNVMPGLDPGIQKVSTLSGLPGQARQ
jgi:hypothetical protein